MKNERLPIDPNIQPILEGMTGLESADVIYDNFLYVADNYASKSVVKRVEVLEDTTKQLADRIEEVNEDIPTIEVGEVTIVKPGEKPSVHNSGTERDLIFDFVLPKGDKGEPPLLRVVTDHNDSQGNQIVKFLYSKDDGKTWQDTGDNFTNRLHIKGYVVTTSALPTTAVNGDIYGVGPTYDPTDTGHTNPIYHLYVKTTTGWVDNGKFTSISAGVVLTTGNSETEVMSLKAVSYMFLPDKSFSGKVSIDKNMLANILEDGTFDSYKYDINFDAGWVQIFNDTGKLVITGATVRLVAFFNSLEPTAGSFISSLTRITGEFEIPKTAKLCIIDFEKSKNTNGYLDLYVTQNGGGVNHLTLDNTNKTIIDNKYKSVGKLFTVTSHSIREDGSCTPTVIGLDSTDYLPITGKSDIRIEGGWRNPDSKITPVAFYNGEYAFVGSYKGILNVNNIYEISFLDIPVDAKYIRCCANTLQNPNPVTYGIDTAALLQHMHSTTNTLVTKKLLNTTLSEIGVVKHNDSDPIQGVTSEGFVKTDGSILITADYVHTDFEVSDSLLYHLKISKFPQATIIYSVVCFYNNTAIAHMIEVPIGGSKVDTIIEFPKSTNKISVNWRSGYPSAPTLNITVPEKINVIEELNKKLDKSKAALNMKVHIYGMQTPANSDLFYIRSTYNKSNTKDILLVYYTNGNNLISPREVYIGNSSLTDLELINSKYLISSHSDSTAPLFNSSVYWHLFALHGYVIPRVSNTVNMTLSDVGAKWKDQLNREYTIGDVTSSIISLLPVIIKGEEGNDTRGWKTPNDVAITTLYHITGGNITLTFQTTNLVTALLKPIMEVYDRKFIIDNSEVITSGDYYCDDFSVSESQIGYDPAYINTWFPTPDLSGATEMARFTWSYNFKGAQCCVNTTIDIRRKVECQSYGATQLQTFFNNGNYKAMFLIPKAADLRGVELDKPFNSPNSSSIGYGFYRNTESLKDINKPIDRLVSFLYNPNDNSYLAGMAAGLSLVSGDTVTEKRNINIPIATSTDGHQRLGSFSPSNTNKFYIAAVNTAPFENDKFNFPNTYFKEINYYVSYFDPADNIGQVYWYKDGNTYVIYAHYQLTQTKTKLQLPSFMEGLSVQVVEKTEPVVLHTTTVQNGNLYISCDSSSNYIVLKTK